MRTFRSFTYYSFAAALSSRLCIGWMSPSTTLPFMESKVLHSRRKSVNGRRWMVGTVPEIPMVAPEEASDVKVVAEGVVEVEYPGGLMAIKLEDDSDGGGTSSLSGDHLGKNVIFPNGAWGVVVAHRPPLIFCLPSRIDGKVESNEDAGTARVLDSMRMISASDGLKEINCFGEPLRSNMNPPATADADAGSMQQPMFAPTPKVSEIALINHPMLTGVTALDCLAPVGRGQNMLWVGHDRAYMQSLALDFVKEQLSQGTQCVYACTDSDDTVRNLMVGLGLLSENIHFVGSDGTMNDAVSQSTEAVAIASAACAIGETYARQEGKNSLIVVDTINLHKAFWDTTTRVLVDVFGVDSVVQMDREGGASSEMRGFFSALIQRSAQFDQKRGGGSVTLLMLASIPKSQTDESDAEFQPSDFEEGSTKTKERINLLVKRGIPLTAANLRKIDIPIPSISAGERRMVLQHIDDLISMSDGQVWFDDRIEARGQRPPMDPQRSITRVGIGADTPSRADAPALRRIVEGMRLALSQASSMDGAEDTSASQKQALRQKGFLLAMHQEAGSGGRRLSDSCIALLAAKEGFLDSAIEAGVTAGTEQGTKLMAELIEDVSNAVDCEEIDETLDISDASRKELLDAIESFFQR